MTQRWGFEINSKRLGAISVIIIIKWNILIVGTMLRLQILSDLDDDCHHISFLVQ